jgi:hypothetical protein
MIAGGACRLLKNGGGGPKSGKRAEFRVTILSKSRAIMPVRCRAATRNARNGCVSGGFLKIWLMGGI